MRFLLFNLVVIGALFYLFAQDKENVHTTVDRAYEAVDEMKEMASAAVQRAGDFMREERSESPRPADAEAAAEKAQPDPDEPAVAEFRWENIASPERFDEAQNAGGHAGKGTEDAAKPDPAPVNLPEVWVAERPVNTVPVPESVDALPPPRDAQTAQPRSKLPGKGETSRKFAIADGETLMTPKERRRDLFSLAEEMELMFVRKVGE